MPDYANPASDGSGSINGVRVGVTEAAHFGDERTTITGFLQRQRDLVAWKVGDASDVALRPVATPTGMTAHGIVRHLMNVERSWLRDVFAGEEGLSFDWTDADPDGEFHVPPEVTMAELLADYAEEARRCDAIIAAANSLDVVSVRRSFSLRWILIHLVEETARHAGHLDLLRERADGSVGEDPQD
ncbi:DinB family protein [Cryobacterium glucosi]|uniref:DinB family protein n=1 Tax=Cryobacterium glucosi TaxID=1259175 RepID=A0ABY2ITN7_9MICO|nr:DinB family protein [Cryobacterium glucosi]TFC23687.1 DinB family protein [Cryobacterium glucosi]